MTYTTFKKHLIVPGKRIVSYPDHKGNSLNGVIVGLDEELNELRVSYTGYGNITLKPNGKFYSDRLDTSLDINLIEK